MWILSCYMAHDQTDPPPSNTVVRAVSAANGKRIPVIIGADANAHHTLWGSTNINTRGLPWKKYPPKMPSSYNMSRKLSEEEVKQNEFLVTLSYCKSSQAR
ncbi:uncharacterized protein LOC124418616 [Lucilia cuprina]|uniref:uncharacterized protein LOC124418616 n=1 Tax=Lucilia cuprina TaxID=7375 RepID=UPI001F066B14|nr:uncharacterized protein LOC124418616 [Lucilia cuprina]